MIFKNYNHSIPLLTADFFFDTLLIMIPNKNTEDKKRFTKQRAALLELLHSTKEHPTAAWLYENMRRTFPSTSLGTVYRNLSVLAEQGKIRVLHNGSGFDRFDGDVSEHNHVICTVCKKVIDVASGISAGTKAEESAEKESGFKIFSHRLDFYGICPDCLGAQENAEKTGKNNRQA